MEALSSPWPSELVKPVPCVGRCGFRLRFDCCYIAFQERRLAGLARFVTATGRFAAAALCQDVRCLDCQRRHLSMAIRTARRVNDQSTSACTLPCRFEASSQPRTCMHCALPAGSPSAGPDRDSFRSVLRADGEAHACRQRRRSQWVYRSTLLGIGLVAWNVVPFSGRSRLMTSMLQVEAL